MTMASAIIKTPVGNVELSLADNCLLGLIFTNETPSAPTKITDFAKHVTTALNDYFSNGSHTFDVPLRLEGTPFQKRVWSALQQIPYGQTLTYGELAKQLNTSPRAIGNACRRNPTPIIVPCHRIVGQNGLTGYAGQTQGASMNIKHYLLTHETTNLQLAKLVV